MHPLQSAYARALVAGLAIVCGASASQAEPQFSGQGLVYSTRAGGYGVAVDGAGYTYVVEHAPCASDPAVWGTWTAKFSPDAHGLIYRVEVSCRASGFGIAVDADGNAYVAGTTPAESFNPPAAVKTDFSKGGSTNAIFVVKIDPVGTFLYSTLVGARNNAGAAIAVDAAGSAYVTGAALYDDFPVTPGAYQTAHNGGPNNYGDAFVFKLDPSGTHFAYSTYLGGSGDEEAYGIAVDADGHAYVGGWTQSADFPITPGALNQAGSTEFVTKVNPTGSDLVYSARVGVDARLTGLAINAAGEAYLTGWTWGDAITTTPGASLLHNAGAYDAYLIKVDPSGASVVTGTYIGGASYEYGKGVAVDRTGTAYIFGETDETGGFPVTARALQTAPAGGGDAFVAAVDAGGRIRYATRLGGSLSEATGAIAVDAIGDVYVSGYSASTDFPTTPGAVSTAPAVDYRPFLAKLVPRASYAASALSSPIESDALGPGNAIDGNPLTRWSSVFMDGQSLYIDLGQRVVIDRILLTWETAYGDAYQVRVADADVLDDSVPWTTVYSTATGDGGVDDIVGLGTAGRYVWIYGRHRATEWGFSLWEAAVFGRPARADNHPPTVSISSPVNGTHYVGPVDVDVVAEARDLDGRVDRVVFSLDGTPVATAFPAPFTARLTLVTGNHTIGAYAVDNEGVRSANVWVGVSVELGQPGGNLALGRPAWSSSFESLDLLADRAVDGNTGTRWSSAFSDAQWIYVDLGNRFFINTVVLDWETAFAAAFELQVSDDALQWTTIRTTTGAPGVQTLSGLDGIGRYVRMLGTARATSWGYSLWEFQVYGTPFSSGYANVAAGKPTVASTVEAESLAAANATDSITTTRWSSAFADGQWIYVDLGEVYTIDRIVLRWETAYAAQYTVEVSNDTTMWRTVRAVDSDGGIDDLQAIGESARFVRILAGRRATEWGISLWEFEVYGSRTLMTQNMAPTSTAVASSIETSGLEAARAIDADATTRWSSAFEDGQWIALDLGAFMRLGRVVLHWETAYASSYRVQLSSDGTTWQTVFDTASGDGDVDDLSVRGTGQYLRILCDRRATPWGFSLWEIEVYGN